MENNKHSKIILYFLIVVTVLISLAVVNTCSKALKVFVLDRNDYIFTKATVLENVSKKYGDHASFRTTYNGQVIVGSDRSLFWSDVGDVVSVYFNKGNTYDNGIISQLISLVIGQLLLFIALLTYVILKAVKVFNRSKPIKE